MATPEEIYRDAQLRLERIRQDQKIRLDTLDARLDNAIYQGERDKIQAEIDQLEKVFDRAIEIAQLNLDKAEAEYKISTAAKKAAAAEEQKAAEQRLKNQALREFVLAGGSPERFEEVWPKIKELVINERTIAALTQQPPTPPAIRL
jgi:hypothetical protein